MTSHTSHSISTLHSKVHHLTTWGYLYNLILLTILLSWYYSQDSAWCYSQYLQHHHINHMRIFVGLDITHKSTVLILLTKFSLILLTRFTTSPPQSYEDICRTWYYSQIYCLDITHKTQLDITHNLYNITTSIIWGYL